MANEKANALTDKAIQAIKQPSSKSWSRDGGGLALCLSPAKSGPWRHWYFIYTSPETGKKCYKPLGSYPVVGLKAARDEAVQLRATVQKGIDPMGEERRATAANVKADAEEQQRREAEEKALTVSGLFADYMVRHAKLNKRESSWREDERLFRVNVEPLWGKRKASDVEKLDCVALLDKYTDRPALCHNVMKLTRKLFNFAVEKDILKHTPFTKVKAPVDLESRERFLTDEEIRKLLTTELPKAAMSDEVKRIILACLYTGQRVGEVCGIHAAEIDGHWWTIPASRAKNRQANKVFLTDTAIELLGTPYNGCFFFPSPVLKYDDAGNPIYAHIDENAVAYAIRKNLKDYQPRRPIKGDKVCMVQVPEEKKMEMEHFTPHDLRRTFATGLSALGFHDEVIDAVTNHKKEGVIKVYNRHKYEQEKQQAMESWERKLMSIVQGTESNVIPISRKKAA